MFGRSNLKEIIKRQEKEIANLELELDLCRHKETRRLFKKSNKVLFDLNIEFASNVKNQQEQGRSQEIKPKQSAPKEPPINKNEVNQLEIKIKGPDSVTEVYHRGKKIFDSKREFENHHNYNQEIVIKEEEFDKRTLSVKRKWTTEL